jgi:hypothetical protein
LEHEVPTALQGCVDSSKLPKASALADRAAPGGARNNFSSLRLTSGAVLNLREAQTSANSARSLCCRETDGKKKPTDLHALRNMIDEVHLLFATAELLENRSQRACELLGTALKLADHLLAESPAVTLGKLGGRKIAERGSEYFKNLAAKRKTHAGGRPGRLRNKQSAYCPG